MPEPYYRDDQVTLYHGDCLDVLAELPDGSVDSVCTDPPYGLEFMGKDWDAPWKHGFGETGYGDGKRMPRPNHSSTRNPMCRSCRKHQRGTKRCSCAAPDYDERPADSNAAFQAWCEQWAVECLRLLKPGGHLVSFGGSRTWHRLAAAVEDAGFELRDSIAWLYGSGFPKSLDVSKAIDKVAGAEREVIGPSQFANRGRSNNLPAVGWSDEANKRLGPSSESVDTAPATDAAKQWQGWGTALKPAFEPIVVARKPLRGTVAANVLEHGTGALNIDACRVDLNGEQWGGNRDNAHTDYSGKILGKFAEQYAKPSNPSGRWPTNVVIDEHTAAGIDEQTGVSQSRIGKPRGASAGDGWGMTATGAEYDDMGGSSRFFPTFKYQAKADTAQRPSANGVAHPTVKPLDLMRWLVRLVTPPHGLVLDPFAGSGTTAEACIHEHMRCITIEREPDYLPLIIRRLSKPLAIGFDFEAGTA